MLEGCSNILECEEILISSLQKIDLISDISLSSEDIYKLQDFISESSSIDISNCTELLQERAPTSLACYLVWNGILHYHEGDFWTSIGKNTGLSDPNWQSKWGNIFLRVLRNHRLPIFETHDAPRYVTNILIQGTIPNSCLCEYYDKVLFPLVTKELISFDPTEVNFLLKSWRDYEQKKFQKDSQLKELEDIKDHYIIEIEWINSIIDLWNESEEIQLLRSKIESIDEPNIDEIIDLRNKTDLEITKTSECIENLEANRDKYCQNLNNFSEEDSFVLRHSETIEDGFKIAFELIAGKKEAAELQKKMESIKKSIDETTYSRDQIDLEIIKTSKCIKYLESNRDKYIQDLIKLSEEELFILRHSETIQNGLEITFELIAGKKEIAELQEKVEFIKRTIDEIIDSRNKIKLEIIKTSKCIEDFEANKSKYFEDLNYFSDEDSFVLRYSGTIQTGLEITFELIAGQNEAVELQEKIESIKKSVDETIDSRDKTNLEIVKVIKCIEDLEANRSKYFQDLNNFSDEDSFVLRHSETIEDGFKIAFELIAGKKEAAELQKKMESIKKSIDEITEKLFVGTWNGNYIDIIRRIRYEELEEKIKEYQYLKNEEDKNKKASKSLIKALFVKLSIIVPFFRKKEKKSSRLIYDEIQAFFNGLPLANNLNYEPTLSSVTLLREITNLYDDHLSFKEKINRMENANQALEVKLGLIANSVGIDSNEDVREIQTKLISLSNKLKTSQENEKLAQIASVEIEKINAKIKDEQIHQVQLKAKLDTLLLKEIPKLLYDYSFAKEKINKVESENQELEAKLDLIVNLVGIDFNEDIREIQTKLISLNGKIKTSKDKEELAQIASVEIEKINAKIENEIFTQTQLKTKHADLLLKEIPKLHYDYSLTQGKINRIEVVNKALEAKLGLIANSVGIDSNKDVREIQTKLISLSNKLKASQENEKLAQIASVEIEKINAKIENEILSQTQLKTKLNDLNRNIDQMEKNSELKKLKQELDLKTKNLFDSQSNLDELKLKIERFKREGQDKSHLMEEIKTFNEKKMEVEAQINNVKSLALPIPTLKFFTYVDKPIQRYFLFCEKHAENFLFQSIKMFRQIMEKGSLYDLTDISLPERVINSFKDWWEKHNQSSNKYLDNSLRCGFYSYKNPVVYFDYSGEIRCKFPSQFLQFSSSPLELYMSFLADNNEVYSLPLRLYRLNESLFESEDLDFEVKFPAENYEFQLIHNREVIKLWNVSTGLKTTIPFMVFDYESKKVIPNNEIPRAQVLIILKSEYLISPADCLFEEGDLYGEWSGYKYEGIDLTKVDKFTISSTSNEYSIQVMEKSPWDVVLSKENLLQGVYSGDSELYVGKPPSIKVSFTEEDEIDNWIFSIYRKNESDFNYLQQNYLNELKDILKIDLDNNLFEIPLEVEECLGKEIVGEFIVRLKNNLHNFDKQFIFCFFPYIDIQFNELIYLPKNSGSKEISLTIQLLENSNFEVNPPSKIISQRNSSLDTTADISEKEVTGTLKYTTATGKLSLPIRIQIPRITWSLKGLSYDKYNKEINEILEIPDEIFYDIDGENLLLKISFPSSISGICTLMHQDSGQTVDSKIKEKVAVFNIARFIDTVKATPNYIQKFSISVSDSGSKNKLIDNPLFSIRKWTIQNIVCDQNKEKNKRIFHIKWNQEGSVKKVCIVFWRLEDEVNLKQVTINGSKNSFYFEIDEKLVKPGRYLLHFIREDPWSQTIFPGENAPNSKEIYIGIADTSLLELGNKEFEAGNYVDAICLYYRKVPRSANIGLVWFQKLNNGLIYNKKYSESLNVLYHLLKNDKEFDDNNCFHVPFLFDRMLSRQQYLKNEDLVVMLIVLRLIGKNESKYRNSLRKARDVMPKVIKQMKGVNLQETEDLQLKIKYVDPKDTEYAQTIIRRF